MPTGHYLRKGHTEITKRKIAISNTGKVFSPERKKSISDSRKKHFDHELIKSIKSLLAENVCSFEAVLRYLHIKNGRAIKRALIESGVVQHEKMKFFNRTIDYDVGKLLLSYAKLNIHHFEIMKRLCLKRKTLLGSISKLELVHGFKYQPCRKSPNHDYPTKPEMAIQNILRNMNIEFATEVLIGNFYFDIHILGTGLLIEVNGDYWHANPSVYHNRDMLTTVQKKNVKRDHFKRNFAKNLGYYTLYIWELDIKNDLNKVREMLDLYIRRAHAKLVDA